MSDSWDDVRSHIAEMRHERGECDPPFCRWCEEEGEQEYDPDFAYDMMREDRATEGTIEECRRN